MRFSLTALVAAAIVFAVPAQAAEPAEPALANANQVIDNLTLESIADLLREMGAQQVEIKEVGNQRGILMVDGGIPYNVAVGLCDRRPGKCLVLGIMVVIENGAGGYPLDTLNTVNKNNLFVTLYKVDSAKFGVGRLHLVDGGVTKRNLAINVASYVATFRDVMQQLQNQTIASVRPGAYQQASFGRPQLRLVPASPREMHDFIAEASTRVATTLRPAN